MKSKKSGVIEIILALICLVLVLYVAFVFACAMQDAYSSHDAVNIVTLFSAVSTRFEDRPLDISFNEYTQRCVMVAILCWLIGFAYWYTSRKSFIRGKEYGTAKWGTRGDIADLYADNIARNEIRKARHARFALIRYFARRKIYRECKRDGAALRRIKLSRLSEMGYSKSDPLYKEQKEAIENETQELVRQFINEAWKPDALKHIYDTAIMTINERFSQWLLTEGERDAQIRTAERKYAQSLKDFYRGKGKIAAIQKKYENADALLTKTERISIYNYKLNNNILILGGSGSGKTRGFVMPNILQAHSSYVITDPKGEILEKSGHYLRNILGYRLRVLNLYIQSKSDGYNPFAYLHPEREGYENRVLTLIETLITNTDGGEKRNSSDPFWEKAERLFLQAMFFFTCDGFIESQRNMNTVLELIGMLQIAEDEDNYDSDLDYFAKIFEREHGSDHIGIQQFKEFRTKASGKTAKSIVISAVARLAPFRTKDVRRIMSYDAMELDRIGEEKTAIIVVLPPTDTTFNFIAGMMYTQLFQEIQYCASEVHKHEGQRLPVPVRFILDEFANTGKIPNFVQILAYARSFGVGIVPIMQSLDQLKAMYEKEWGVIVDNCNALLYLGGITHNDTLEYMSKLLGKGTFDKKTFGRTRSKQGSTSTNLDVIGRELMLPDEIRKLPKSECLLVVGGRNPFHSEKYEYTSHPNYRFTSDANPSYSLEYEPLPNPAIVPEDKSPHGEDFYTEPQTVLVPGENAVVETDDILLDMNCQSILNQVGRNLAHYIPAPDELVTVEDGEDIIEPEQVDELLALLSDEDAVKAADTMLSLSAESTAAVDISGDIITLNTDALSIATHVCRANLNIIPAPDELMGVDDGEEMFAEDLDELEGISLEDSTDVGVMALEDEITGLLNSLIDELPPELRDTVNLGETA